MIALQLQSTKKWLAIYEPPTEGVHGPTGGPRLEEVDHLHQATFFESLGAAEDAMRDNGTSFNPDNETIVAHTIASLGQCKDYDPQHPKHPANNYPGCANDITIATDEDLRRVFGSE